MRRLVVLAAALALAACNSDARRHGDAGVGGGGSEDLSSPLSACATAEYDAHQAPAALLVVLDRSSSMTDNNKWNFAAQAVVQALDQDIFDSMYVGLYSAPSGNVTGPECILGTPVACQAPPFPQVNLALASTQKSMATSGVRHDIMTWLTANSPDSGFGDASPIYAALQSAIGALQAWSQPGKRIILLVTDGTISCNQFSSRPGYMDCNGCSHDWEDPNNIVSLLSQANSDPNKPIETFVVGVPGADTYDAQGCSYPPYHMRLALSAIAAAGSPTNVPPTCTGKTFSQGGGDPQVSCHFDLTQGNFNTQALSDTISLVRGKVLGCTFDLPQPDGGMLDPNQVNVEYTVNGNAVQLYKRKDPANLCAAMGCWDYSPGGDKVQLVGKACDDVQGTPDAQVKIIVGCQTLIM